MGSRKCFVYCNDCAGFVIHDNTEPKQWEGKKSESCTIYCNKCRHILVHPKSDGRSNECCFAEKNKYDNDENSVSKEKGKCKDNKCNLADTLVSIRDPTSNIFVTSTEFINLVGWSDLVVDVNNSFDNKNGIYTVLCDGDYEVSLVVNYSTAFPITLDTPPYTKSYDGNEIDNSFFNRVPHIELYDVCTGKVLLASQFPVVHSIITCPCPITGEPPVEIELRSLLGSGAVIINGVLSLQKCQKLRFRAVLNGLEFPVPAPIPPNIPAISLSAPDSSTTASFKKLRDTPKVCYKNNDYSDNNTDSNNNDSNNNSYENSTDNKSNNSTDAYQTIYLNDAEDSSSNYSTKSY